MPPMLELRRPPEPGPVERAALPRRRVHGFAILPQTIHVARLIAAHKRDQSHFVVLRQIFEHVVVFTFGPLSGGSARIE